LPVPLGHVDALLLGGLGHLGLVHERGHLVQRQLAHLAHVLGDEVDHGLDLARQRAADARDARDREGALVPPAHDARGDRHAVVARLRRARNATRGGRAAKGRARHVEAGRAAEAVVVVLVRILLVVVVLARPLAALLAFLFLAAGAAVPVLVVVAAHARRARAPVQVAAPADLELHHRDGPKDLLGPVVLVGRARAAAGAGRRGPHGVLRHARRLRHLAGGHGLALRVGGDGAVVAVGHWGRSSLTRMQIGI
ncbi:MAG: hypothetical protein CL848_04905, partial [Crocinitomicaceae bacterium]|nr:hypothetical protein [Crocinitomicaceae bacterium]